ncbi:uncharacterized protein LOC113232746 [Hyposmocoma kahamanoa]|uniref:uncharacterized protein LOC113232746 n=1 Tax=Hyposmocoma kahamanoa TaxID=1477025 RepID=UPI000E6D6285|nr:uncharacterized protein LOC113232746 [Hyposmocoma kahamanoa]
MWNVCGVVILVLFNEKYCRGQDVLQETTTLGESIEETFDSANVIDGSTAFTDNPDNWNSFGEFIDSSSTTEFTGYFDFDEFQESTTNIAHFEDTTKAVVEEPNFSELIPKIIEELKQPYFEGIPGVDIPDPDPIPDMSQSLTIFDKLYFTNSAVRGLSKLRILYINIDVEASEVQAAMHIDTLHTSGNYRYSSFMTSRNGPYSVIIRNLLVTARANIGVQIDGKLRAQDITMELSHESIDVKFENLDPLIAGIVNNAGNFIFDTVKPYMLKDAYTKARTAIDTELEKTAEDLQFPNSLPPLDMILIDVGKKVRELGFDPYRLKDYVSNDTVPFFSVALYNTWITGVSTFHRVGNITVKVANGTAVLDFEVGTKTIEGSTHWNVTVCKIISNIGKINFSIEHFSVRVVISQPLDIRLTPKLIDLQIDVGNLQMRSDGAGTADYILELAVNIIPNLIRYHIVDALQWPLRNKIQEKLDKLNVEETIKQELLPKIHEIEKTGFKLSFLRSVRVDSYDDDEFFNF